MFTCSFSITKWVTAGYVVLLGQFPLVFHELNIVSSPSLPSINLTGSHFITIFTYHQYPALPCFILFTGLKTRLRAALHLFQACTQVAECGWRKQTTSGSHFKLLVRTLWGALRAAEESSSAPSLLTSSPPFSTFTLSWWHFSLFYWEDWSNQENFCNVPALSLTTPCVCIHGLPLFLMLYAGGLCLLPGASPLLPVQGCCSGGSLSCIITFPSFYLIILISIQTCCYSSHPKSKK